MQSCESFRRLHFLSTILFYLALTKDFWDYCEERQGEERIIAEMKIKG